MYRLSYRENADKFPFDIEPETGWIKTNRVLDREEQSRYDFEVIAADSGDVPLSATASVHIVVQDGKIKSKLGINHYKLFYFFYFYSQ